MPHVFLYYTLYGMSSRREGNHMLKRKKTFVSTLAAAVLAAALVALYQDGIYRDVAPGYNDEVIVTVTVRDGEITALTAENRSGEESEYFGKAEAGMAAAILEKQGIEGVDTVTGATGTSQSILTAMEGILEQAVYTGVDGRTQPEGQAT